MPVFVALFEHHYLFGGEKVATPIKQPGCKGDVCGGNMKVPHKTSRDSMNQTSHILALLSITRNGVINHGNGKSSLHGALTGKHQTKWWIINYRRTGG